ncbi:hypothetical protein ES706_01845 [subsurface metagenome]
MEEKTTDQNSDKFLSFLGPAAGIGVGSTLLGLISVLASITLLILGLMTSIDAIIATYLILFLAQTIGAVMVYFLLIPFFRIKNAEYRPMSGVNFRKTVLLFCLSYAIGTLTVLGFVNIFLAFNLIPQSGYAAILLTEAHLSNPFNIVIYFLPFAIGAAVFEELIYRRMLIPWLEKRGMTPFAAVVVSSLVFALGHLANDLINGNAAGGIVHVSNVLILAMVLGMTYVLTRNVVFPMIIHGLSNFISLLGPLLLLIGNDVLLLIDILVIITMLIIGVLVGISAVFKYLKDSRTDWINIIKKKSENKISKGSVGFTVIGLTFITIPVIIDLSFTLLFLNGIMDYFTLIGLMVAFYFILLVVLVWVGRRKSKETGYKPIGIESSQVFYI